MDFSVTSNRIAASGTSFQMKALAINGRVLLESPSQIVAELTGAQVAKETIAECCYHSMTRIA